MRVQITSLNALPEGTQILQRFAQFKNPYRTEYAPQPILAHILSAELLRTSRKFRGWGREETGTTKGLGEPTVQGAKTLLTVK